MQDFILVRVESPAFEAGTVHVAELRGTESLSRLFELELRLMTMEVGLDEDALLSEGFTVVFERRSAHGGSATEVRKIPGMIRAVIDRALTENRHREYLVNFVPRVWQASLSSTSDVCLDVTVPQIFQQKLKEGAALEGADIELRLDATYPLREFVVQYKETNLDFVCRLAEDLGICFFFEELDGKDVMVFGDKNTAFKPSFPPKVHYQPRGEHAHVFELEARRQLVSQDFVARDYNYRNPSMEVFGEAKVGKVLGTGKVDEFGPHAKTPEEANFYAKVRAEEAIARSLVYAGQSDLPGLRAGSVVTIEGHPRGEIELVVTEVHHEVAQGYFDQADPRLHRPYRNRFHAIPKVTAFRPARLTPKPVVNSVITGVVESESPTDFGAIDDQGRYRVAFMYDAISSRGEGKASRPLRMAQPSAAADRGFHTPLKPGTEVIISCVNGDPDRPIIAGAVPNPQTPSPVTSSISNKSIWVTNKSSIAIDDHSARVKIVVNGEDHCFQMGEPESPESGILVGTVGNHSEVTDKDKTEKAEEKSVYVEELTVIAAKNILEVAGVSNPISQWTKKVEEAKKKLDDFMKEAEDLAQQYNEMFDDHRKQAKEDKEAAEKDLKKKIKEAQDKPAKKTEEAKQKQKETNDRLKKELGVKDKAKPQTTTDPATGQSRTETQAEAEQRTYQEELAKNPAAASEAQAANKNAADAEASQKKIEQDRQERPIVDPASGNTRMETKDEAERRSFDKQLKHDPEASKSVEGSALGAAEADNNYGEFEQHDKDRQKMEKDIKDGFDAGAKKMDSIGKDLAKGKIADAAKKLPGPVGKYAGAAADIADKLGVLKKAEEAIKKTPAGKKLISLASKIFGTAARQGFDATVKGTQVLAHSIPKASKERHGANVGVFDKPFNIQFSRGSASLYGLKNVFVFGKKTATLFSASATSVLGTQRVDVKSRTLVEVAAKDVCLTGYKSVDLHASEKLKLVAHDADKSIEVPSPFDIYIHAKSGVLIDTVEKDFSIKAKQNIRMETLDESFELKSKKSFKLETLEEGVNVVAKKKIELTSQEDGAMIQTKKKLTIKVSEDEFSVYGDKGGKITANDGELKLTSKGGIWKADSKLELKADKLTVNADKIELG